MDALRCASEEVAPPLLCPGVREGRLESLLILGFSAFTLWRDARACQAITGTCDRRAGMLRPVAGHLGPVDIDALPPRDDRARIETTSAGHRDAETGARQS